MVEDSGAEAKPATGPLSGLRIVCFESRRSAESSRMIARLGGTPIEAPALREVPLHGPLGLDRLFDDLVHGRPLSLLLLTGVGAELMIEGLAERAPRARILELLAGATIVCRGPKPHATLKACGIRGAIVVGEPNTWRDVLAEVDAHDVVRGRTIYVQEYGRSNGELLVGLEERAPLALYTIKTYVWSLPQDLEPLRAAIRLIIAGGAEVALFTSGIQLNHVLQVAAEAGQERELRAAFERVVLASMGPATSEALRGFGLTPDVEPVHPKLGHLLAALGAEAGRALALKRGQASP